MKMRRIIAGAMAIVMSVTMAACSKAPAQTPATEGTDPVLVSEKNFRWKDVEGGVELTAYTGDTVHVQVPDTMDGKNVVSLGSAFVGNDKVQTVGLPAYTKRLDGAWFEDCDALRRIEGYSVQQIVGDTLDIDSLEELVLPEMGEFHSRMVTQCEKLSFLAIPKAYLIYGYEGEGERIPWPETLEQVVIPSQMYARIDVPESWGVEETERLTVWSLVYEPMLMANEVEFPPKDHVRVPTTDGAKYYCSFFQKDKIIVNGQKYRM